MKITHFYTNEVGDTRFSEIEIPIDYRREDADGNVILLSKAFTSPKVRFVILPEGYDHDWHNAPRRQIVILLSGVVEVRTSDNQIRRWGAGDVMLADDVLGKGHQTRAINGPVRMVYVPLPADFSLENWSTMDTPE
jgi:quercetin dioxygenase-like cupin family protein